MLVALRVVIGSLLPGYVHPDEFFQGGQELFFGCPPLIPWEFEPHHAVRSIIPPTVMTWLPLKFYSWVVRTEMEQLTGLEILVIPRLFCGLASVLAVDASVYFMTRRDSNTKAPTCSMWILATSWPAWVITNRPFSNGLETLWLAVLLHAVTESSTTSSTTFMDICIGILCSLGLFTRFTFVFFAIPVMILYLLQKLSAVGGIVQIASCSLGFSVSAGLIIMADTLYFGGSSNWTSFITPLNALLYNSRVDNLQHHGLHPRWTHVVVNMLILYGPMALLFYGKLASKLFNRAKEYPIDVIHQICTWTVISGLTFLSLAPHQEPRFLSPLLVPLSVVMGKTALWSSPNLRFIWIIFNLALIVVFGVLHQGGVVPTMLSSVVARDEPLSIMFHHSYMPPSFLSRRRQCTGEEVCTTSSCPQSPVNDLKGSKSYELTRALELELQCKQEYHSGHVHLVAPSLKLEDDLRLSTSDCRVGGDYSCELMWSYWPHLATEDFPSFEGSLFDFIKSFELIIYKVACK